MRTDFHRNDAAKAAKIRRRKRIKTYVFFVSYQVRLNQIKEVSDTMERPHSRKVKVVEGTAEVKKGEKVENAPMAGSGDAPLAGNKKDNEEDEK